MFEGIYIVIAVLIFLGKLEKGFFYALSRAFFWPVLFVGTYLYLLFSMLYKSVKKVSPYERMQDELSELGIRKSDMVRILDNETFCNEYIPSHLKIIEKTVDGQLVRELPKLDNEADYLLFRGSMCSFWDDHDFMHQTDKGWFFCPKH